MKLLFVLRHAMYLRLFESTLRELLQRGHAVDVGYVMPEEAPPPLLRRLTATFPACRYVPLAGREDVWKPLLLLLRHSIDYLRYLDPCYRQAPKLAARAGGNLPPGFPLLLRAGAAAHPSGWRGMARLLRKVERLIPPDSSISAVITKSRPDIVVVSPLVDHSSAEVEYLKAAQALGRSTVYCVASWDNLTNKGLVQIEADKVTVWNEFMRREAVEMHGLRPERVAVTGAPVFDHWFSRAPSRTQEEFLNEVGLPQRPVTILYLCSSGFIAANEVEFVRRWLAQLRRSGLSRLREAAVLIRPHPANTAQWRTADFSAESPVVVWPRGGAHPMDDDTKADYFDSMYYSDLVVGLNTSGLIEAGIVGKPVFTVLDPSFAHTQGGTLHFHYLVEQGLLSVATDLTRHMEQMADALEAGDQGRTARMRFLEVFVRPLGLTAPCAPILASAIETAANASNIAAPVPSRSRVALRLALAPLAWACSAAYHLREAVRIAR